MNLSFAQGQVPVSPAQQVQPVAQGQVPVAQPVQQNQPVTQGQVPVVPGQVQIPSHIQAPTLVRGQWPAQVPNQVQVPMQPNVNQGQVPVPSPVQMPTLTQVHPAAVPTAQVPTQVQVPMQPNVNQGQVPVPAPSPVQVPTLTQVHSAAAPPVQMPAQVQAPLPVQVPTLAQVPVSPPVQVPVLSQTQVPVSPPVQVPALSQTQVPVPPPAQVPNLSQAQMPVPSPVQVPALTQGQIPSPVPVQPTDQLPVSSSSIADLQGSQAQLLSAYNTLRQEQRQLQIQTTLEEVLKSYDFNGSSELLVRQYLQSPINTVIKSNEDVTGDYLSAALINDINNLINISPEAFLRKDSNPIFSNVQHNQIAATGGVSGGNTNAYLNSLKHLRDLSELDRSHFDSFYHQMLQNQNTRGLTH